MSVRYRFGAYLLDPAARELVRAGTPVTLAARVLECLECLIVHRERAVGRDELAQAVFSRHDVSDAQLAQIVVRARRAVGDDGQEQHSIRTVPRFGFRWVAAVEVLADPPPAPVAVAVTTAPAPATVDAITTAPDAPSMPASGGVVTPTASTAMPDDGPFAPAASAADGAARVVAHPQPEGGTTNGSRRWLALAAVSVVLAIAVGWAAWSRHDVPAVAGRGTGAAEATTAPRAVAVLPLAVTGDAEASWARLGLMDFIGDRFRRSGLPVPGSEAVLGIVHAAGEAHADDDAHLRRAMRVAWLAHGTATRRGDAWTVAIEARHGDGTRQSARAEAVELLDAARIAADRLAAALGGRPSSSANAPQLDERLQRARVAMLANELDAARAILLEAPELQRAQPRLQYQLARVDFRAGAHARGVATLDAVLKTPDVTTDPTFHAQVLNARAAMLLRLDRVDEARAGYDAAVALVDDGRHPTELGVALSGRSVTWAMQERYDEAIADMGHARVQFDAAGDALAAARIDGNLGVLETERGRPALALHWLGQAIDALDTMGAVAELATVRNARANTHLQLLQLAPALADSDRTWALLPRIADPAQRAEVILTRADALLAAGRMREAARLLAMPDAAREYPSERGRRALLEARLAAAGGDDARAVRLADAALADWPPTRNARARADLLAVRERAAGGTGERPPEVPSTAGDTVSGRIAQATRRDAAGDATAGDGFAQALALAERRGIPAEIAAAAAPRITWLLDHDQAAQAAAELGRLAPWVEADYDLAVLQARTAKALGQTARWQAAWRHATALAGERPLPSALAPPGR